MTESSFEKVRRKLVSARLVFLSQLANFTDDELSRQVPGEPWTPLQVAWHIYLAEKLALEQLQRVQREDNPLIINLTAEAPRLTSQTYPPSLQEVLAALDAQRGTLFTFLAQLSEDAWQRPSLHEEWGQLKFYQLVNVLPFHERQHAQHLENIKAHM